MSGTSGPAGRPPRETVRILLADDHALMREGVHALLSRVPGIAVVAEACNGREAVELALELKPDVVLLDVSMPDLNGMEAARRIISANPETRILALSMHSESVYVEKMLEAGALGYLLKDSDAEQLLCAVNAVSKNIVYLDKSIAREMVKELVRTRSCADTPSPLTSRQAEVLQLVAEGRTTKEIASLLGISLKTVETFRRQIMVRLDIHSIAGLTRYAVRQGLTSL